MGEVWRATDTRLEREVAIKVLPASFAADAQLRIRFEREAKTISSLNHPHICTLHDVGHDDGIDYLVMEMIEGETLADRLKKGSLPLDQVLKIGAEIAEALDTAHARGIVHRDLKPGNVMLTKTGAKLLDFGLAKSGTDNAVVVDGSTGLATEAKPLTREGTILGTFQYMAPEQFEGVDADARTDIFALGVVLYEMATGRRAFEGKTRTSLIAAIVSGEPKALSEVVPFTPGALEHVVRKCLEKEPEDRWHSAHDVAAELRWIAEGTPEGLPAPRRRTRERVAWGVALAALAAVAVLGVRQMQNRGGGSSVLRASLLAPPGTSINLAEASTGSLAISPDGMTIVLSLAESATEEPSLWLRRRDTLRPTKIAGTEGAFLPFWSPDGRFIGFFSGDDKLKKVDLTGAPPVLICAAPGGRGGTWNRDGTIVAALGSTAGLVRVPAGGGAPVPLTQLDGKAGQSTHRYPWFLPDGKHFLYFGGSHAGVAGKGDTGAIFAGSLDGGAPKLLFPSSGQAAFADGRIFFVRDGVLLAQRFDDEKLETRGDPVPVAEGVSLNRSYFRAVFAVSDGGLLAYRVGETNEKRQVVVYDRSGVETFRTQQPDLYVGYHLVSIDPDARRLLFELEDADSNVASIWTIEMNRGIRTRVTFGKESDAIPVWSADGARIAFARILAGLGWKVMVKDLDSAVEEQSVWQSPAAGWPTGFSPDGRVLACTSQESDGGRDVVMVPLDGGKPVAFLASPAYSEYNPQFSPDGRWVCYTSEETGRPEIYAVSWPDGKGKQQISNGELTAPALGYWHEEGITWLGAENAVTTADVRREGNRLQVGAPRALFQIPEARTFSVSPDGSRISTVLPLEGSKERARQGIELVMNWQELVRRGAD